MIPSPTRNQDVEEEVVALVEVIISGLSCCVNVDDKTRATILNGRVKKGS